MSYYTGPSGSISTNSLAGAEDVEESFERFADSVNKIDGTNFFINGVYGSPEERVLTHRAFHSGSITQSFEESQLIQNEPATWIIIARTAGSPDDDEYPIQDYSLGRYENDYTADGCSLRVLVNRPCELRVDSYVQIDEVKRATKVWDGDTTYTEYTSLDLQVDAYLRAYPGRDVRLAGTASAGTPAGTHGGASGGGNARKVMRLIRPTLTPMDYTTYRNQRDMRRGFMAECSYRFIVSEAPANGGYVDIVTHLGGLIAASQMGGGDDNIPISTDTQQALFYVHLKSLSRGIIVRVHQTEPSIPASP